mgnify:FL=1
MLHTRLNKEDKKNRQSGKWYITTLILVLVVGAGLITYNISDNNSGSDYNEVPESCISLEDIPDYQGTPYIEINNNEPFFTQEEKTNLDVFENYSELDELGRCGAAYANVCRELMPTEPRGEIGDIKPTGWHTVKYNDIIDGNYLYNRCHLIGYQLTGENDNARNLITGTRYLNINGMLPFENMIYEYLEANNNHVLYRVTPVFEDDNLVASGVLLEGYSVEDSGSGICFNVYCYNIQPGIHIDYATGDSYEEQTYVSDTSTKMDSSYVDETDEISDTGTQDDSELVWISATGSKYHSINNCGSMNPDRATQITRKQAEEMGYSACKLCW